MLELLVTAAVAALLVASAAVAYWLPPETVILAGATAVALGLAFGVPTGVMYHVALRRCLAPRGELPRGWLLRPTALHGRLHPAERAGVLGWCYAGAAGWMITVLGCLALAVGVVRFQLTG